MYTELNDNGVAYNQAWKIAELRSGFTDVRRSVEIELIDNLSRKPLDTVEPEIA
ncbi:MAG: hypothetical protein N2508_03635 [Anaerolineae bacterium]|nr:hypothetical protein [Anaerolineae bacterium]